MNRTLLLALVAGALAGARPATARAQDVAPPTSRDQVLRSLFADLAATAHLRIVTSTGTVEEGWLEVVESNGIRVGRQEATVPIGFLDMRTVQVEGGHGLQGAIWGLAGGILAGSVFGLMAGSFDCTTATQCNRDERRGAIVFGSVVGVVGGAVGYWVGRRDRHWHPVYP